MSGAFWPVADQRRFDHAFEASIFMRINHVIDIYERETERRKRELRHFFIN